MQKTPNEQKAKSTHLHMPCFNKVKFLRLFKKASKVRLVNFNSLDTALATSIYSQIKNM